MPGAFQRDESQGFVQFPSAMQDPGTLQQGTGSTGGAGGSGTFGQGSGHGSRQRGSASSVARIDEVLVDPDGEAQIIGRMKTQWNEDMTLMQLLLFLFEMHTFAGACDVPEEVWEGLARAVFEVENVILNPILTTLSSTQGYDALKDLVQAWREFGPGDFVYDASGRLLDRVVEPEVAGTVHPTCWRSVWENIGNSARLPVLMWFYMIMSALCLLVAAGLMVVGIKQYKNDASVTPTTVLSINITSAAVVLVFGCINVLVGLSIAHHNAVMHGIVNFMEVRRFRDLFQLNMIDGESNLSMSDGHHEMDPSSSSIPSVQEGGVGPSALMGPSMSVPSGPGGSSSHVQQFGNTSFGKPGTHHGNALASSGSRGLLPRFANTPGGASSMLHLTMLGGLSTIGSTLGGAFNNSAAHPGESERDPKAFVLCNDTTILANLCACLWKHRVPVVAYSDPRDFAAVAIRARHDRMRILFVFSEMVSEAIYTSLKPMEEQSPQQIVYFSSPAYEMTRSDFVPKHLITYGVTDDDVARFVLAAQEVAAHAVAMQDIMRTGKHFTIPHYNLGRRLGGGAFGNVFEAEMESLGGRCAVKRIYFKPGESSERLRDIGREVDIMSKLDHPNIVKYLFCRREGNCICIFMELCEGGSLAGEIQKRNMTPDAIKHNLRQMIEAVMYLHANGIIHHDLKPENVLFRNGSVKLTDFGTAAKFQQGTQDKRHIKGTFPFMAPEVLLQEPYGYQCDVWSIGCIAADMLGIPLEHRALNVNQLVEFFKNLNMMMAIEVDAEEPHLRDFVERCFCRDPLRRPTPQILLDHQLLKSDDSSIRRHMEHSKNRPMRRPSLGIVSLRSMGLGGPGHDNESEF